jgi:hypothetical protein
MRIVSKKAYHVIHVFLSRKLYLLEYTSMYSTLSISKV